jgi:DNA-binding IclR family transcriptional regulator
MLTLPKSVVHRTLEGLMAAGLILRDPETSRYRLGPRALDLGFAGVGAPGMQTLALPLMEKLSARTQETATLSYLVEVERVYVAQVEGPQAVKMTIGIGHRAPLYAGASGRAILSAFPKEELERYLERTRLDQLTGSTIGDVSLLRSTLEESRQRGYATSFGERDPWAAAVAAPICTAIGHPIGSMSVCGPLARFEASPVDDYGKAVCEAAAALSALLAGREVPAKANGAAG